MGKSRGFGAILVAGATVFISSFCIMVLELVASRLIARHLGSSLYTWTSVIGVVLAGITVGNYIGGRIADRFGARKALAILFGVASASCVLTVICNNLVGEWLVLLKLNWPLRVFSHVVLVFLLPSAVLGTISPVVAKMALDEHLPTGRTMGDIYAWGAAGSIAGTFAAGYWLIAAMGTVAIVWIMGGVLLLMGIAYRRRLWPLYVWGLMLALFAAMGMADGEWARQAGSAVSLRPRVDARMIYENETQYCYVAVERIGSGNMDHRAFMQDKLKHSEIIMGDVYDLQYFYTQVYAAVTGKFSKGKEKLTTMTIGGGGYVYPRYIEAVWPGSLAEVVEIDPGVTEAAIKAFGLERETSISTHNLDARNYVDELLERKSKGEEIPRYDFIYGDALNDYSVPFQLVTREFNEKIDEILAEDGIYMVDLIDIYDSGLFLGAVVNTLQETFANVYVITELVQRRAGRNTFVVIASRGELELDDIGQYYEQRELGAWVLGEAEIDELKAKVKGLVLTDDHAPVENLMAPVVVRSSADFAAAKCIRRARQLAREGESEESLRIYREVIEIDPSRASLAYNDMATVLAGRGRIREAIEALYKVLELEGKAEAKRDVSSVHYSLGVLYKKVGRLEEASEQIELAVAGYRAEVVRRPKSFNSWAGLGYALAESGRMAEAGEAFAKALAIDPLEPLVRMKLVFALDFEGKREEAIGVLQTGVELMRQNDRPEQSRRLQALIMQLERRAAQPIR